MNKNKKDQLYTEPLPDITGFVFDEKVAEVFPDMINRSVPGYATIIDMIGLLALEYARPDSVCYDLGCSLGAATIAIQRATRDRGCRVVAIDNSEAMLQRFREQARDSLDRIELVNSDISAWHYENASFVTLNFTLQFLSPAARLPLLEKLHAAMLPGACLVLSEKVVFDDGDEDRFHDRLHTLFKRANGYSELEISQKRAALENVLIRDSIDTHKRRLHEAGFNRVYCWFQCFNFISLVAFRD